MASADVDVVVPLLQALLLTATGVVDAYGNAPFTVTAYPVAIVYPGPADEDWETAGGDGDAAEGYETRTYNIILAVAPSGVGTSGEVIARTNPFYAVLRNLFAAHPLLGGASYIFRSVYLGDSGLQLEMDIGGIKYAGTRCQIRVTSRVRVQYAKGE
jgi:hypothetical protein